MHLVVEERGTIPLEYNLMQRHPSVLVIDDEPSIVEMLEMLLEDDYKVSVCLQSSEALQQAEELRPDLIIMDVMMPDLSGVELLRIMRTYPVLGHVPVILMTAGTNLSYYDTTEQELKSLKAWLLKKPFDNSRLLALMKELV